MYKVDLNSDIGEAFGPYKMGCDEEIVKYITSANLGCGFHGGDPLVMAESVALCRKYGIGIGAHPGFPDLMGFGRRLMKISYEEARAYMTYQLGALMAFAQAEGLRIQHFKAHGALGNTAAKDPELAKAICDTVTSVDPSIVIMQLPGGEVIKRAKEMGLRHACEVFADRGYNEDLSLVKRGQPGAMIHDPDEAAERVIRMIKEHVVTTVTGKDVEIDCDSVCVHGDTPEAIEIAKKLRETLEKNGIVITKLTDS